MNHLREGISMGLAIMCALRSVAAEACFGNQSATLSSGLSLTYYPPAATCQDYMIPITIEPEVFTFNGTKWEDNFGLEDFIALATTRPSANFPGVLSGPSKKPGDYQIAATFCTPKKTNGREKNVILATHGIGPARYHWNSAFRPEEYNFVQHAIGEGYSVFFYDRLGCGASSKVSGYEAQLTTAAAVIQALAKEIKSGHYTGNIGKPSKLALMGFSFGSYATHTAAVLDPDVADALILTAIGFNMTGLNTNGLIRSFTLRVASIENPLLYGALDTGYLTWKDNFAQILNYFKPPNYDPLTVDFVETTKSPFAITEFLTLLSGPKESNFRGPVLGITGEFDYIFCDGYCGGSGSSPGGDNNASSSSSSSSSLLNEPATSSYYSKAKKYVAIQHPGTSHHINFHRNATGAFRVMTGFLDREL